MRKKQTYQLTCYHGLAGRYSYVYIESTPRSVVFDTANAVVSMAKKFSILLRRSNFINVTVHEFNMTKKESKKEKIAFFNSTFVKQLLQ